MNRQEDFNQCYKVLILCNSSPKTREVDEHRFIQRLRTLRPYGLNAIRPFGIPLWDILDGPVVLRNEGYDEFKFFWNVGTDTLTSS